MTEIVARYSGPGAAMVVVEDVVVVEVVVVVVVDVVELVLDVEVVVDSPSGSVDEVVASGADVEGASEDVDESVEVVVDDATVVVVVETGAAPAVASSGEAASEPHADSARISVAAANRRSACCRVGARLRDDRCCTGGEQLDDRGVELINNPTERKDVQYALAVGEQVDDFFAASHQHRLVAVDDEVGGGDVFAELVLQIGEHLTDLFEPDTGVEEILDDLELEEVSVRVLATRARAGRVCERRTDQIGAGPVVELPIGDADDLCGALSAEADGACLFAHDGSLLPRTYVRGITVT